MIKRISHIRNIGILSSFTWTLSIPEFKTVNIFYGRNYSGKTTLSRVFRTLETMEIPQKYSSLDFCFNFESGETITRQNIEKNNHTFCVFNRDFIKENLSFIHDDTKNINSFAIIGKENVEIEQEIDKITNLLGDKETFGLYKNKNDESSIYKNKEDICKKLQNELESKLSEKAIDRTIGIKYIKKFDEQNYNIASLKKDIERIKENYIILSEETIVQYEKDIKEEKKDIIKSFTVFELRIDNLATDTCNLVEKAIKISEQIPKFIENTALAKWADEGRSLHKNEKECAFCGNMLSSDVFERLEKHFNEEYENLRKNILNLISNIEQEKEKILNLFIPKKENFYSKLHSLFDAINESLQEEFERYQESLKILKNQLNDKLNNIFKEYTFSKPITVFGNFEALGNDFKALIKRNNEITARLEDEQKEARNALKFVEIFKYLQDISYDEKMNEIKSAEEERDKQKKKVDVISHKIEEKNKEISILRNKLRDETRGVDIINNYLKKHFGHTSICLEPILKEDNSKQYVFEINRNGDKAFNLSEGECSLIAFCYFLARLSSVELYDKRPIICIDDPISSLDYNHIFFMYSMIRSEIVDKKNFTQMFIFTHNLDFLKYLKRLYQEGKFYKKCSLYILERVGDSTSFVEMPDYMKRYISEFIYLFNIIYSYANSTASKCDNDVEIYSLGNDIRKFLEMFLYYKYPSLKNTTEKIKDFLGDDRITTYLIERVYNEYSHLEGLPERGMLPLDVPEMISVAQLIMNKIKENDKSQYDSFLEAIGAIKKVTVK